MRRANKRPSEWLKSLCRDWATENIELVESADAKFMAYKPYLKGLITSQLLCRLSLPAAKDDGNASNPVDFWSMLGIEDEFDKAYIVAQMERFCGLYSIRSISLDDTDGMFSGDISSPDAAAAGISVSPNGGIVLPDYMDQTAAAAAAGTFYTSLV